MAEEFAFNARQFYDFSKMQSGNTADDDHLDLYFDQDHESANGSQIEKNVVSKLMLDMTAQFESSPEMEFYTPRNHTPVVSAKSSKSNMKKSTGNAIESTTNAVEVETSQTLDVTLCQELEEVKCDVEDTQNDITEIETKNKIEEPVVECRRLSRVDIKRNCNRVRSSSSNKVLSQDHLNRLAQPKRTFVTTDRSSSNSKYVSVAEAVGKFQSGTPVRFRSVPHFSRSSSCSSNHFKATIPVSPKLATKNRVRPSQIVSRDEKEKNEAEELKKFKIKANPLNKKILQGPLLAKPLPKKASTVPEPFHLTPIGQKSSRSTIEDIKPTTMFHAKPVPKTTFLLPKSSYTALLHPKVIVQPSIKKDEKPVPSLMKGVPLKPTILQPFSFDTRDKDRIKRKDDFIKKQIAEEKPPNFKAKPLPEAILRKKQSSGDRTSPKTRLPKASFIGRSIESLTKNDEYVFKARPPKVLQQKPFEPKKEHLSTQISEFKLNTVSRAKQREEYEIKLEQKEKELDQIKLKQKMAMLLQEQEQNAQRRKETNFKAQPVKKYKSTTVVSSEKVTNPHTPNCYRLKNKENMPH